MPPIPQSDYNPIIIGFVANEGYVDIPLLKARDEYGQLPSEYGLVPKGPNRRLRKTLNLSLGLAILRHLRERTPLAETVAKFYERWGRDFRADFGVQLDPFLSRNDPVVVKRVVDANAAELTGHRRIDIREHLRTRGMVTPSTLQSIPDEELLGAAGRILEKKTRNPAHRADREALDQALALIRVQQLLGELSDVTGGDITLFSQARLAIHADEIARVLWSLSRWQPLREVERLTCVQGRDVEFEFAPRNASFFALGKEVGDCTADKPFRQVDRDVENIYWTVFSWFLDRHYQILKVFHGGQMVMKVHLLPLLILNRSGQAVFLAVDAVETTPAFREDTRVGRSELLERKEYIFRRAMDEVVRLARAMGIDHVYAEKFSNTGWVRQELDQFPEIYVRIGDIRKVDELEDIFELARRVCAAAEEEAPASVFMELQAKNTYLLPGVATVKGVKAFAVLAGDTRLGIPMKQVVGV